MTVVLCSDNPSDKGSMKAAIDSRRVVAVTPKDWVIYNSGSGQVCAESAPPNYIEIPAKRWQALGWA